MKILAVSMLVLFAISCGQKEPPKEPQTVYEADTTGVDSTSQDSVKKVEEDDDHTQEQIEHLALPIH